MIIVRPSPSCYELHLPTLAVIPYVSDEEADAANKNPNLKLLFRLVHFKIMDEGMINVRYMHVQDLMHKHRCRRAGLVHSLCHPSR